MLASVTMCNDDIRNSNRKNNIIRWFGLSYTCSHTSVGVPTVVHIDFFLRSFGRLDEEQKVRRLVTIIGHYAVL